MRKRSVKKRIVWGMAVAALVMVGALLAALDIGSWKRLDMEILTNLSQTTFIYDRAGAEVADLSAGGERILIDARELPAMVKNAFIAIEDARFYAHPGVDLLRIGGATLNNLRTRDLSQGASTITQQLIKLTHLTAEKTFSRKAQEAWLALQLERRASKDEILSMYLNVVYFGRGAYGIEAASRVYFNKSARELTLDEAALLAGVIKSPSGYAPHVRPENALARRELVLAAMVENEFISQDEAHAAAAVPLALAQNADGALAYGWYVDQVLLEAKELLGQSVEEIIGGGYHIHTGMNPALQAAAEALFADSALFPANAADGTRAQAALVCIGARSGEIECLVGGRSYDTRRGLNRATQSSRQPGSAFKPVSVYAAAIDALGYTPVSLIEDVARDFGGGYSPQNASGKTYGLVTLRQALARSMNIATVDLMTKVGVETAMTYARRAGIPLTANDANLSLALGSLTDGVSPAQLCGAYAALANGGQAVAAHAIVRIEDAQGQVIYEHAQAAETVMRPESARMITSMLEGAARWGTASALAELGFPVAAKTGTVGMTDGSNRDAWAAAYTPAVVATVWMGFDRPDKEHSMASGTVGGSYPAKLIAKLFAACQSEVAAGAFPIPEGLTPVLLDNLALSKYHALLLASESTPASQMLSELLPSSVVPTQISTLWEVPQTVRSISVSQDAASGQPLIAFQSIQVGVTYQVARVSGGNAYLAGEVFGQPGEALRFVDETADVRQPLSYFILPRHDAFYAEGKLVQGEASPSVAFVRSGPIDRLLDSLLGPEEPSPAPGTEEVPESPLFGALGRRLAHTSPRDAREIFTRVPLSRAGACDIMKFAV